MERLESRLYHDALEWWEKKLDGKEQVALIMSLYLDGEVKSNVLKEANLTK